MQRSSDSYSSAAWSPGPYSAGRRSARVPLPVTRVRRRTRRSVLARRPGTRLRRSDIHEPPCADRYSATAHPLYIEGLQAGLLNLGDHERIARGLRAAARRLEADHHLIGARRGPVGIAAAPRPVRSHLEEARRADLLAARDPHLVDAGRGAAAGPRRAGCPGRRRARASPGAPGPRRDLAWTVVARSRRPGAERVARPPRRRPPAAARPAPAPGAGSRAAGPASHGGRVRAPVPPARSALVPRSAAASARTVCISRSRSSGGGSSCSTAVGSISTEACSQRARSWQRAQPSMWRSIARASSLGQRVEQVGGEVVLVARVVGVLVHMPSASVARIFSIASRIRPFTVPSGMPSTSAISEWLSPPK